LNLSSSEKGMRSLLGLATFIVILDLGSKWWMSQVLTYSESISVLPGFFQLTLVHNTGGAFGLFANQTFVFVVLSIITIFFLLGLYRAYASKSKWLVWPIGLVLGGAVGNLIDRVRYGYVVDFLDFFVKDWHWPAFNLADSCICVGLGILAFYLGKKS